MRYLFMLIFVSLLLVACGPEQPSESASASATETTSASTPEPDVAPVQVVATTGMVGNVAEVVGGDCASVTIIMGPGVDPHLYQASASDVQAFQEADIILYSGLNLEGQLGEVFERLSESRPVVPVAGRAIPEDALIETGGQYDVDPHVWMSAELWANTADVIAEALAELVPACQEGLEARAQSYQTELSALHDWAAESIASIPEQQRILITAHDAFEYYSRAYGIEVAGIQGISTESEAAIADIREVVDIVVAREVPAIFVESTISPRTIEAVQQAAADRGQTVEVGGSLFSDAMGQPGTAGGTYIGMIVENTRTITGALGGSAPPLPDALQDWAARWEAGGEG